MSQLVVGLLQIFEHDSPGDAVHDEVMNHDQEAPLSAAQPILHDTQERPSSQIEACLDSRRVLLQHPAPLILRVLCQVPQGKGGHFRRFAIALKPLPVTPLKSQALNVMMSQ